MKSMTGYGKARREIEGRALTVELKSVNNRFLDINCKLPRAFFFLEDALRKTVQARLGRGRVDVFLTYEDNRECEKSVQVDTRLAEGYLSAAGQLRRKFQVADDLSVTALMKFPDVVKPISLEEDEAALTELLKVTLDAALDQIEQMRLHEGENLKKDLLMRLENVRALTVRLKERAPLVSKELGAKLRARVEELLAGVPVDENKLLNEVAFLTDKVSIDEELARLDSHISQMAKMLEAKDAMGRKLDFIVQEFNREANTVCSKANDTIVTAIGLDLKSEIEKIREQVQNVE